MGEFASLAEDLSADSPCGENLEYDPSFLALEAELRGKADREFGDTRTEAVEPDWRAVRALALALFERTRDLRLGCALARAATVQDGLPGLTAALELLERLIARQWAHVHPQLDPDDELDPTVRMNVLAAIIDPLGLQRDLGGIVFVRSPAGRCTVREAEAALRGDRAAEGAAPVLTRSELQGRIRAAQVSGQPNGAGPALIALRRLGAAIAERVGSGQGPDLSTFERRLQGLANAFDEAVGLVGAAAHDGSADDGYAGTGGYAGTDGYAGTGGHAGADEHAGADDDGAADGGAAVDAEAAAGGGRMTSERNGAPGSLAAAARPINPRPAAGAIQSRADVARELDRIAGWLERHEPANPAALLIRRAQRVVQMNFIDLLRDLAPEGLSSIEKIAGLPTTDQSD